MSVRELEDEPLTVVFVDEGMEVDVEGMRIIGRSTWGRTVTS